MRLVGSRVKSVVARPCRPDVLLRLVVVLACLGTGIQPVWAGQRSTPTPAPAGQSQSTSAPLSTIEQYQGLKVASLQFRGFEGDDARKILSTLPLATGQPLQRSSLRESIRTLYATGRFADIQAEVERAGDDVSLVFVVAPNYFVGQLNVDGAPGRPTASQIINASKLNLGELFTREKMDRAVTRVQTLLQENGYYRSTINDEEQFDPKAQAVNIWLRVSVGERAHVGALEVSGHPRLPTEQLLDIAHFHTGDPVSADRLTDALQRLRKKYQKQNRLLAQVTVDHRYQPGRNAVDYTLNVDPGPVVQIAVEGMRLSRRTVKKYVPVYEENALDEDLLNEGRRNLLDYLQTRGFFEARVGIKREQPNPDLLRVTYVIDPGPRHNLVRIAISGNKYFDADLLLARMQVQAKGRLLSHGRYSQTLLASDIGGLEELYRANGFANVKITSDVIDNYEGVENQLAVDLKVDEGPQTLVASLQIAGNKTLSDDQLIPLLSTSPGQPFSEFNVGNDRDSILNYYFNHGFPSATFEASAKPVLGEPNRMDVTFTIREGEQVFVDQVFVSGLEHTRPYIVQHQLQVHSGDPISQLDMLDTQRRLYDLGIFNQVDTAIQNPDGQEPDKNVLVNVREARRYTFNYGVGLEFQTGQPAGVAAPTGRTGVSPRVSFDVTRLNFRGRDHTITFKSHVGRLQQRVLLSYDAPRWFNQDNLRLTFTAFYDNTLDVTTFTSQRLEGSVQATQTLGKADTLFYRFAYRQVRALNFATNFTQQEVPLLSQPARVGMPGLSFIRDHRDNPVESTRGSYTTFDSGVSASYFGSEADFSRLLVKNSTYYRIKKKYVIARSTTIGVEDSFGNTDILSPARSAACAAANNCPRQIPLPERFFSGGGNSLRGFGLNQAGPRDLSSGFPVGGAGLFINNLELRLPPVTLPFFQDNISFALFHDAGNVFDTGHDMYHNLLRWTQKNPRLCTQLSTYTQCDFNYVSHAVGLGLRYKTPVGPVRFDFGYNLNPPVFPTLQGTSPNQTVAPRQASHFTVYFSIGQTF